MVPDLKFVNKTFHTYNSVIFGSELPEPKFSLTKARTFRGKLLYKLKRGFTGQKATDFELRISLSFDLSEFEWEDVVIHEMIHLYIASKGIKDSSSHGPEFKKLMHAINRKHNRKITVSVKSTAEKSVSQNADMRIKAHYICIALFRDGRVGVAPVAKTRIFNLWNIKKFFPDIISIKWIGSTDPYFNSFPHVQSPKLYIVKKEDILSHLKGAQPLEKTGNLIKVIKKPISSSELLNFFNDNKSDAQ